MEIRSPSRFLSRGELLLVLSVDAKDLSTLVRSAVGSLSAS